MLWFQNRRKLRALLEEEEAERRRQFVHAMRCDPRFAQLREISARLEGVTETFQGMIELQRREQERLRRLSKGDKRKRIKRLLRRDPRLTNRALATIFGCSPQSVLNYRNEVEEAGEIPVLERAATPLGAASRPRRKCRAGFCDRGRASRSPLLPNPRRSR